MSAEVKALRQWCEAQLKKLSADEGEREEAMNLEEFLNES